MKKESTALFDVDQTLVIWHKDFKRPGKGKIKFIDPYTNEELYLKPHNVHIRLLKQYKGRGYCNVVWSMGGYKWAETIVKQLKLEDYVDIVMSKARVHIDDKDDKESIIGSRLYLPNDEE